MSYHHHHHHHQHHHPHHPNNNNHHHHHHHHHHRHHHHLIIVIIILCGPVRYPLLTCVVELVSPPPPPHLSFPLLSSAIMLHLHYEAIVPFLFLFFCRLLLLSFPSITPIVTRRSTFSLLITCSETLLTRDRVV